MLIDIVAGQPAVVERLGLGRPAGGQGQSQGLMLQVTEELRAVEEILLLILDTDNGEMRHAFPMHSRAAAFAGAALMDLALESRIDSNADQLIVADPTPLGNELLDPIFWGSTGIGRWP